MGAMKYAFRMREFISFFITFPFALVLTSFLLFFASSLCPSPARADLNGVMMQYFHWYTSDNGEHWKELERNADSLAKAGFTALWLPPATKGMAGAQDVGYGLYDLYDLGEFDQKGSIRTKYGTKSEYLAAIQAAHRAGLSVYSDLILNHLGGADQTEWVRAVRVDPYNRNQEIGPDLDILAGTRFLFPGRGGKYSSFTWSWIHFDGTDWDHASHRAGIYKFRGGKEWDPDVDDENGNFDFLLFNDTDLQHPEVRTELKTWGKWFAHLTAIDGFRIDAAKHTQFEFTLEWLEELERAHSKSYFAVAEYWSHDLTKMRRYIEKLKGKVSLFDFPLQDHLAQASKERGYYDLRKLYDGTLVQADPIHAVTFVENHDTQRHFGGLSRVDDWFKPLAYALLLLRREGYPCLFYPDYFGLDYFGASGLKSEKKSVSAVDAASGDAFVSFKKTLDLLLSLRHNHAHGEQHSYFDNRDIIGWTREGDEDHPLAMAVVISDNLSAQGGGEKTMFVGKKTLMRPSRVFKDVTGNFSHAVTVGDDGIGVFPVQHASDQAPGQSLSIWVEQE